MCSGTQGDPTRSQLGSISFARYLNGLFCINLCLKQYFFKVTLHSAPAYMMDTIAYVMGKKPVMKRVVEKMHKAQKVRVPIA